MTSLLEQLQSWRHPHILVVGDVMLDRYTIGDAERVSPEAPVLVLRAEAEEVRLGGAASVAALLRGLESEVTLAGVIGDDAHARVLRKLLDEDGIDHAHVIVDESRRTTVKERILGRAMGRPAQQIVRVDYEQCHVISWELEDRLWRDLSDRLSDFAVVLISDYAKGFATAVLVRKLIDACRELGLPVLVDPGRGVPYDTYRGATIVKPNRMEAESAWVAQVARVAGVVRVAGVDQREPPARASLGHAIRFDPSHPPPDAESGAVPRILSPVDALEAGKVLCERYDFGAVVVTLDRDGVVVVAQDPMAPDDHSQSRSKLIPNLKSQISDFKSVAQHFPTRPRSVCDITGAGDTVLATLGLCMAEKMSLHDSAQLANLAAGLQVERQGVAVVSRNELQQELAQGTLERHAKLVTLDEMATLAEAYRQRGQSVVFTNGCFDLLHVGHVTYLQEAATLGDILIVAINSDAGVRRLKGPSRPIIPQHDRAAMLAALACVAHVLIFDEDTPHRMLRSIRPDVFVKGGTTAQVIGHEVVESYGGKVIRTGRVDGMSTSAIVGSIQGDKRQLLERN